MDALRLHATFVDYALVVIYFVFVLGIGFMARRWVSDSLDFFLSGRSLPAWVTGLAFISANLGAVEIMGMSANGAQFGMPTMHYFWIGAVPAMLFLGVVMMPFYYGSKVRSVPEFMRRRFGTGAHLVNAISFAVAQVLIAGINLYLLAPSSHALLGWPLWVSLIVAAIVVLSYITLGGLSAAIYNEVLQFFVIVAALLPLTLIGLHRVGGVSGLIDKIDRAPRRRGPSSCRPGRARTLSGFDNPVLVGRRHRLRPGLRAVLRLLDDELRRGPARDGVQLDLGGAQRRRSSGRSRRCSCRSSSSSRHDRRRAGPGDRQGRRPAGGPESVEYNDSSCYADARRAAQRPARRGDRRPAGRVHGRHGGQHLGLQHRLQLRPVAAATSARTTATTTTCASAGCATVGATVIAIFTALIAAELLATSWTTCRRCSGSSTPRCSRRSSSACSGSG